VAEADRPVLLIETGVAPRWYIPPGDVAWAQLEPDPARTTCQYKGEATYFRVRNRDVRLCSPKPGASPVADTFTGFPTLVARDSEGCDQAIDPDALPAGITNRVGSFAGLRLQLAHRAVPGHLCLLPTMALASPRHDQTPSAIVV
jgi:Domain of unknown function (DUF427)